MAVQIGLAGFIDGVFIDSLELTQHIELCGQSDDVIVVLKFMWPLIHC